MSSFYLNDEEWLLLFNERPELLKIYSGIKRVMDYKTGIAGISYRLSDSFFTDLLFVEAIHGRKAERYTREKIRSAIKRMESIGILTRIGPNVFKLNFVKSDNSVQKDKAQTTTRTTTSTEPEQQPNISPSNVVPMGVREKTGRKRQPQQDAPLREDSNPPLTSNYKLTNCMGFAEIHDFLKPHIGEEGLIKFHNRKLIGEWIELGLASDVLQMAVGRAVQCTQGKFFNVSYLDPIVREYIQKNDSGDTNGINRQVKSEGGKHGAAGSFLREQQEAAMRYAEKHELDMSEGQD